MKILKILIAMMLVLVMFSACGQSAQPDLNENVTVEASELATEPTERPTENNTEAVESIEIVETTEPAEEPAPTTDEVNSESIKEEEWSLNIDPYEIAPNGMTNRELLACVVYQEAGWDLSCDECRFRVADVVLNRVSCPFVPDTVYGVLTQRSQDGRFYWTDVVWTSGASYDDRGVQRAYDVVDAIFSGQHSELYGENYVWQAEFPQGHNNLKCCGTYYGQHSH